MRVDVLPSWLTLKWFSTSRSNSIESIVSDRIEEELRPFLRLGFLAVLTQPVTQETLRLPLSNQINSIVSTSLGFFKERNLFPEKSNSDEIFIYMDILDGLLTSVANLPPNYHPRVSPTNLRPLRTAAQISISHYYSQTRFTIKSHVGPISWDYHRIRLQIRKFPCSLLQETICQTLSDSEKQESEGNLLHSVTTLISLFSNKDIFQFKSRFALFAPIILRIGRLLSQFLSDVLLRKIYETDPVEIESIQGSKHLIESSISFAIRIIKYIRVGVEKKNHKELNALFKKLKTAISVMEEKHANGEYPLFLLSFVDFYKVALRLEDVIESGFLT
jgi:hypothetical protein